MLLCIVSLRSPTDAYKQTDSLTWRTHRLGIRGHVPDQTIQLAFSRCDLDCNYREAGAGDPPKTTDKPSGICDACSLRCDPHWELDCLDKISVWRSNRISVKNHFAWLDT